MSRCTVAVLTAYLMRIRRFRKATMKAEQTALHGNVKTYVCWGTNTQPYNCTAAGEFQILSAECVRRRRWARRTVLSLSPALRRETAARKHSWHTKVVVKLFCSFPLLTSVPRTWSVTWNFLLGCFLVFSKSVSMRFSSAASACFAIFFVVLLFRVFENSVPVKSSKTAILVLAHY